MPRHRRGWELVLVCLVAGCMSAAGAARLGARGGSAIGARTSPAAAAAIDGPARRRRDFARRQQPALLETAAELGCADQLSEWSEFSPCSVRCGDGGHATRTRRRIVPAGSAGACDLPLTETISCPAVPCPQDCQMGGWSAWTPCEPACGPAAAGSQRRRYRAIVRAPANGGRACGPYAEVEKCDARACPADCRVGAWSAWTPCDTDCGGGSRSRRRPVVEQPAGGGGACPATEETEACNTHACPVDCLVGAWSPWSACTASCAPGGVRTRSRRVLRAAATGGRECGVTVESEACNTDACPVDCVLSEWDEWTACTATCAPGGTRSRRRRVSRAPNARGARCGALEEHERCGEQACPVDCVLSAWSEFTACSRVCDDGTAQSEAERGQRTRSRSVLTPAAEGGRACGDLAEVQPCGRQRCPVACVTTAWSAWTPCSATCGGGSRTRSRRIVTPAAYGGAACGDLDEQQTCSEQACPVNCALGDWEPWSACSVSCGGGVQFRKRPIAVAAQHGGDHCSGTTLEERACSTLACAADCAWTQWGPWSACSVLCGVGTMVRMRTEARHAEPPNGRPCIGSRIEEAPCYMLPCASAEAAAAAAAAAPAAAATTATATAGVSAAPKRRRRT